MTDKTESETTLLVKSGNVVKTLCGYDTTQLPYTYSSDGNVTLNNFPVGMHFRSKTEAIERLCLQVFGATPVYGTDVEDFKAETPEEMTKLEVELNEVREQLAVERELAERLEEENADLFLRRWAKAQERAIDAERALKKAWYIMDTIEGNDAVDEWQNKYSKYIESDYISCLDCDALASHGVNDGPCEKHKKD